MTPAFGPHWTAKPKHAAIGEPCFCGALGTRLQCIPGTGLVWRCLDHAYRGDAIIRELDAPRAAKGGA